MLINILNTLAITASLGSHLIMPQKNNLPNRDLINKNITLTSTSSHDETFAYSYYNDSQNTRYMNKLTQVRYLGRESNIQVEATKLTEYTYCNVTGYYAYGNMPTTPKTETMTPPQTSGWYIPQDQVAKTIANYQELWILKVSSSYGLVNAKFNITDYVTDWVYQQNTVSKKYVEIIQTEKNLDNYMTERQDNELEWYIENDPDKTLKDTLYTLKYDLTAYTSTIRTYTGEYTFYTQDTDYNDGECIMNENVVYSYGKDNYYIIYTIPYYYTTNSTGTVINTTMQGTILEFSCQQVITTSNVEVVDIPGTMIYVLGMPFTFISTAFNLTIFPGTPYQINLSMLFLSIIAVLVFVFLLKVILNAVGKQ